PADRRRARAASRQARRDARGVVSWSRSRSGARILADRRSSDGARLCRTRDSELCSRCDAGRARTRAVALECEASDESNGLRSEWEAAERSAFLAIDVRLRRASNVYGDATAARGFTVASVSSSTVAMRKNPAPAVNAMAGPSPATLPKPRSLTNATEVGPSPAPSAAFRKKLTAIAKPRTDHIAPTTFMKMPWLLKLMSVRFSEKFVKLYPSPAFTCLPRWR